VFGRLWVEGFGDAEQRLRGSVWIPGGGFWGSNPVPTPKAPVCGETAKPKPTTNPAPNPGPQHPAAHGAPRLVPDTAGEVVERAEPQIGSPQCAARRRGGSSAAVSRAGGISVCRPAAAAFIADRAFGVSPMQRPALSGFGSVVYGATTARSPRGGLWRGLGSSTTRSPAGCTPGDRSPARAHGAAWDGDSPPGKGRTVARAFGGAGEAAARAAAWGVLGHRRFGGLRGWPKRLGRSRRPGRTGAVCA
jgi:hypothetical protein